MKIKKATEILKAHNNWRRGHIEYMCLTPKEIGEAIDTVVAELDYLSKYSEELQKTVIPHISKIERLIRKQQRTPQDISWFIAEASSIVVRAFQKGVDFGYSEGRKNGKG